MKQLRAGTHSYRNNFITGSNAKKFAKMKNEKTVSVQQPTTKEINKIVKAVINKSTVLPILECVCLTGDKLTVSDLETHVTIPFKSGANICIDSGDFITATELMNEPVFIQSKVMVDKPTFVPGTDIVFYGDNDKAKADWLKEKTNGQSFEDYCLLKKYKVAKGKIDQEESHDVAVTIEQGKKKIKVTGESVLNFVALPDMKDAKKAASWTDTEMQLITTAMVFASGDDLRPAMTGIYFGDAICATDAHRLFFHPITEIKVPFIIPYKTCKILTMIGGNWEVRTSGLILKDEDKKPYLGEGKLLFINENGIEVYSRAIDAKFPKYKVVLPEGIGKGLITANINELAAEIKTAMKFANRSTNQVAFLMNNKTNKVTLNAQEIDFGKEYSVELENAKLLMKEQFDIAFNGKFLIDILNQQDWAVPVKIKLWGPTKAAIINEHFLIMPLLLYSGSE